MAERIHAAHVGAPDPARRNSPILEETADDADLVGLEAGEMAACYFNDVAYPDRSAVCSGDRLLRCERGSWVHMGSCDPDNP